MTKPFKHGLSGYGYHKCRCDICKAAKLKDVSEYQKTPTGKRNHKASLKKWEEKAKMDPFRQLQKIARSVVYNNLKAGKIEKKPCSICGNPEVEAHHRDYTKPLEVDWLCKIHHVEIHKITSA